MASTKLTKIVEMAERANALTEANVKLGRRIRHLREKKGLGQAELGGMIGRGYPTILAWEKGHPPGVMKASVAVLLKLAQALDTTLENLLRGIRI